MELDKLINFNPKTGQFVLGSADEKNLELKASMRRSEVDELLAELSSGGLPSLGIYDPREAHILLAQNVRPPIERALPYMRWTDLFFQVEQYDLLEDNAVPVDNITVMGWQTSAQGQVMFTRPGYSWTRPSVYRYDGGLELSWDTLRKAGWNILERAMRRIVGELARKVDAAAKTAMDTAISGVSHNTSVSGGTLTKAAVDSVIKQAADIGFPITVAAINPGTLADMAGWSGGVFTSGLPDAAAEQLLTTLYITTYGGIRWYTNPFVPVSVVYLGGPGDQTGYEQRKGTMEVYSDIDIQHKMDKHVVMTPEIGHYIANPYRLWSITITS